MNITVNYQKVSEKRFKYFIDNYKHEWHIDSTYNSSCSESHINYIDNFIEEYMDDHTPLAYIRKFNIHNYNSITEYYIISKLA